MYLNGTTVEEAILIGSISGLSSYLSISNLANLGKSTAEIATTAVADLIFGTGYSALSAAIYKAVTSNNSRGVDSSNSDTSVSEEPIKWGI